MKTEKQIFYVLAILLSMSLYSEERSSIESAIMKINQTVAPAVVTIRITYSEKAFDVPPERMQPFFDDFLYRFFKEKKATNGEYAQKYQSIGSGFIVCRKGYILTNEHVVLHAEEIKVSLFDGEEYNAKLIASDSLNDIALLKMEGKDFPDVKIGDSDQVQPGQLSIAVGNPFGNLVNSTYPSITSGIVSAINRSIDASEVGRFYVDLIQTDAAINQGNSGGPLLNLDGEVIGINTIIFSPTGGNVGMGFAIPINRSKPLLEHFIEKSQNGFLKEKGRLVG